jgi:hypothetical protein
MFELHRWITIASAVALLAIGAAAQDPNSAPPLMAPRDPGLGGALGTLKVPAGRFWFDSGVRVRAGETVRVRAWGRIELAVAGMMLVEPNGIPYEVPRLVRDAPSACLLAVIGDSEEYIVIGRGREFVAQADGPLIFGLNQVDVSGNAGAFTVRVAVAERRGLSIGVDDPALETGAKNPISAATTTGLLVAVAARRDWTNTFVELRKGDVVTVEATGTVELDLAGHSSNPDGIGLRDPDKLIADRATGALIAVVGVDNNDFVFIGSRATFTASRDGLLFLGLNEGDLTNNSGEFTARVLVSRSSAPKS